MHHCMGHIFILFLKVVGECATVSVLCLVPYRGSTHLSQTDSPFISSQYAMKSMGFYSPDADIYEVFDASLQLMYAFLNRHLWNGR